MFDAPFPGATVLANRYRFRLLFAANALFIGILSIPVVSYQLEIAGFMFFIIAAVIALMKSKVLPIVMAIGVINLLVYLAAFLIKSPVQLPLFFLRNIPLILLYITVSLIIFRHVVRERPVTEEIFYGLGALYLQMGLTFAFAFDVIECFFPGSLVSSYGPVKFDTLVYFSIVTLTTLGYGDIQVVGSLARILVCTESILGVLFIALIVSRVISMLNSGN